MKTSIVLCGLLLTTIGFALPTKRDDDSDNAMTLWWKQQQQQKNAQQKQTQLKKATTTTAQKLSSQQQGKPVAGALPQAQGQTNPTTGTAQDASDITVPLNAPLFPSDPTVPLGSYICNGNSLYQRHYITALQVGWVAHAVCQLPQRCIVDMTGGRVNYVGCR
ncbi:UNVERIFIED_CONTAM: hypothetical protein HDU68_009615 [Siphonaria sp. JEL0065]|nr:hypothetical protein HDU68_009615 [Siphonaria sp. JEL0065]